MPAQPLFDLNYDVIRNLTVFLTEFRIAWGEEPYYYEIAEFVVKGFGIISGSICSLFVNKHSSISRIGKLFISILGGMILIEIPLKFFTPIDGYLSFKCIVVIGFVTGFYLYDILRHFSSDGVKGEASNLFANFLKIVLARLNNALNFKSTINNWDQHSPSSPENRKDFLEFQLQKIKSAEKEDLKDKPD